MDIRKFKNGNFNVRVEKGEFNSTQDFIVGLCNSIEADFEFVGEEYFNVGRLYVLYNCNTNLNYNVLDNEINGKAKTIKLYGYKPVE